MSRNHSLDCTAAVAQLRAAAIATLRAEARSLLGAGEAGRIAAAFGHTLASLGIAPRHTDAVDSLAERITVTRRGLVVGAPDLAVALARAEVARFPDPGYPYHGTGRNAEHRTLAACEALT